MITYGEPFDIYNFSNNEYFLSGKLSKIARTGLENMRDCSPLWLNRRKDYGGINMELLNAIVYYPIENYTGYSLPGVFNNTMLLKNNSKKKGVDGIPDPTVNGIPDPVVNDDVVVPDPVVDNNGTKTYTVIPPSVYKEEVTAYLKEYIEKHEFVFGEGDYRSKKITSGTNIILSESGFIKLFTNDIKILKNTLRELNKEILDKKGDGLSIDGKIKVKSSRMLYRVANGIEKSFERWRNINNFKELPIGNGTRLALLSKGRSWRSDFETPYGYKYTIATMLVSITIALYKCCVMQNMDYLDNLFDIIRSVTTALEEDIVYATFGREIEQFRSQSKSLNDESIEEYDGVKDINDALIPIFKILEWDYKMCEKKLPSPKKPKDVPDEPRPNELIPDELSDGEEESDEEEPTEQEKKMEQDEIARKNGPKDNTVVVPAPKKDPRRVAPEKM